MPTATWTCNKDARVADNGTNLGAGTSDFNPVGNYGGFNYYTLLGFSYSFSGMTGITSAILHLRTSNQYYVGFGSDPDIRIYRLASAFSEGSASSMTASNAVVFPGPGTVGPYAGPFDISTAENTWVALDITSLIQACFSAGAFYGLRLFADSSSSTDVTEFYSREQGSSDPYITVTYSSNVAPTAPTGLTPATGTTGIVGTTPTFAFNHNDSDGDALLDYDLQVSTDSTFASVTHWNVAAQTSGVSGNSVSRVYAGTALTRGTKYYWRCRTSSAAGILTESPWSVTNNFTLNRLPTVAFVLPSAADANIKLVKTAGVATNPRMVVQWTFTDPDGPAQAKYQVVVVNDSNTAFWDSGLVTSGASSVTVPVDVVRGNYYKVTVTVTDSAGETATTGQRRCHVQWALVEYRIDLGAVVTAWSTSSASSAPTNTLVVTEYASSAAGTAIGTWFSSLASAVLNRWFHYRVWLFAWSGAASPSLSKMAITYTNDVGVPPDGWTVGAQHALDTSVRVYGTQSLRATCNGTTFQAWQLVPVEKNTDYILSGRIKADGNPSASIVIAGGPSGATLSATPAVTATQDFGRVQTNVWNSGNNDEIYIHCRVSGAAGAVAWFDALKLEASTVVTAWTPGFVGAGVSIDAGGIRVDASPVGGATLRLQGSLGGARDTVELGSHGLRFGNDLNIWSANAAEFDVDGYVRSYRTATGTAGFVGRVSGDGQDRFQLVNGSLGGLLQFSDGVVAPDTNIYRSAANTLKTDDTLLVAGALQVDGLINQVPVVRVYAAGATWTKPAATTGFSHALVEVQAGGGGSGGTPVTAAGQAASGGDGGGGGYCRKLWAATALPATVAVTVGGGGTAGAGTASAVAGTGGTSSFIGTGVNMTALGGVGGTASTATTSALGAGGTGGTASGGDINIPGGEGSHGIALNGANPIPMGTSGSSVLGTSVNPLNSLAGGGLGTAGHLYGGGASRSTAGASLAARAGAAGGAGVVIVTEFYAS